jgi:hypothetical protein
MLLTYSARQLFGGDWDWDAADAADGFVAIVAVGGTTPAVPLQRLVVRVQHHAVALAFHDRRAVAQPSCTTLHAYWDYHYLDPLLPLSLLSTHTGIRPG